MGKNMICMECGTENEYEFREVSRKYEGDDYSFNLLVNVPFCKVCGAPIDAEEVEDEIAQKANRKVREERGIISIDEIRNILMKYEVSQKFLSRLLGWGEITLTRYVTGGYTPNKENSNRLKELDNPYVFQKMLESASDDIKKESSFRKVQIKVNDTIEKQENCDGKIYKIIDWFLMHSSEENPLTHLALQKLLYFAQCWSKALNNKWLFPDDCEAWAHGAVYHRVYHQFKRFKYMPLPIIVKNVDLNEEELEIVECVKAYYFDVYNATTLENICHNEGPYQEARKGLKERDSGARIIPKEEMEKYYKKIAQVYQITSSNKNGIRTYLFDLLKE